MAHWLGYVQVRDNPLEWDLSGVERWGQDWLVREGYARAGGLEAKQ